MKEVKIVRVDLSTDKDKAIRDSGGVLTKSKMSGVPGAEEELAQLVNGGWEIITAGGGGGYGGVGFVGFVVLTREQ
jgi:hypothetical protein